jgi:hypothetical protein
METTVKIERITNEIKAKVFASFLNENTFWQDCDRAPFKLLGIDTTKSERQILLHGDWSGGTNPEMSCKDWINIEDVKIYRKPLDSITDEDTIEVAKVRYSATHHWLILGRADIEGFLNDKSQLTPMQYEFLASKGYDLPQYLLGGKTLQEVGLAVYEN